MNSILRKRILNEIKPSMKEHAIREKIAQEFVSGLEKARDKLDLKCSFFVGGSFGKGTYLKMSSDVDIFARFDLNYEDSEISEHLKKMLDLAKVAYKKQKGSRDYYSSEIEKQGLKIKFEIVPNREIKRIEDAQNSTDVSPMHVEFLKSKMLKNSELTDEIRLAKQFFKAHKLYGAESYINGFSGHIIDILIANFGSLESLINEAKSWGEVSFVDIKKFYKNYENALEHIEKDKISKLIVVDPIVKTRNAARALSDENYFKFLLVAQNFKDFQEQDFKVEKIDFKNEIKSAKAFAKKSNLEIYIYKFGLETDSQSEDIVGSKLLKLHSKFKSYFEKYDFKVFKNDFIIDLKQNVCLFVFYFEKVELASLKRVLGPYVYMKDGVKSFIFKREEYFIENNRLQAYEKRDITKVKQIYKISLKDCQKMLNKDLGFVKNIEILK